MKPTRSRPLVHSLAVALALTGAPALGLATSSATAANAASAATTAPYCGIRWGSLQKSSSRATSATLHQVRSGRHGCYDRLVIDLTGSKTRSGYTVGYVDTVRAQGSGRAIPLRGAAQLSVRVKAAAYTNSGRPTYHPADPSELVNVAGYRTFRQVAWGGSQEGESTIGLGVRARLPFRVFTLAGASGTQNGSRLVIDVAHRW